MTRDRVGALFFLALSIAYGILAQDIRVLGFGAETQPFTPRTMPTALAFLGGTIAFLMLVLPPRPSQRDADEAADAAGEIKVPGGPFVGWGRFDWWRLAGLGVAMAFYASLLTRLGFVIATTLFLVAGYLILGERRVGVLVGASLPVVVVFWAIMTQLLDIYLAPGILAGVL